MIDFTRKLEQSRGYLSVAVNNDTVDYLELAYLQALNIKITQSITNYAVIVDNNTLVQIKDKHRNVFDKIIVIDEWSFLHEWQVYNLTPWKETVKIDVDLIFTRDITHWWDTMSLRDVVFTTKIYNYKEHPITSRWHRKQFDNNLLPDIYTALYYFRHDNGAMRRQSADFFKTVQEVSSDISSITKQMRGLAEKNIGDDELFAIASLIHGEDSVIQREYTVPQIVHFKNQLNDLPPGAPWSTQLYVEPVIERNQLRLNIGHYPQLIPAIHYCDKTLIENTNILEVHEQFFKEFPQRSQRNISTSPVTENTMVCDV